MMQQAARSVRYAGKECPNVLGERVEPDVKSQNMAPGVGTRDAKCIAHVLLITSWQLSGSDLPRLFSNSFTVFSQLAA